jgi:hypothetical protein
MQWHPLFAQLLRPVVEEFYDVQINVPVGEAPREADIVLLQRKTPHTRPFKGVWSGLTVWSILEFKSPTVVATIRDIDLLAELGLGIDRRLNERRAREGLHPLRPQDVSFWYLANRLSRRFLRQCEERLGPLKASGAGVWRARLLQRQVFLVSNTDLPVDQETLPLHIVSHGRHDTELAVARYVIEHSEVREHYAPWLLTLHSQAWTEARTMSHSTEELEFDIRPAVEYLGLDRVIEQVGLEQVINQVGMDRFIEHVGMDRLLASLTPAQRRDLKRRLR